MDHFSKAVRRISVVAAVICGVVLLFISVASVANVIFRLSGSSIPGTYEIVRLGIMVAASFSLVYATYELSHVTVTILVDRFSQRIQKALKIFTSAITLVIIAFMTWQQFGVLIERWTGEETELLEFPWLPSRLSFVICLVLFCFLLLFQMYKTFRNESIGRLGGNDSN